MKKFFIGASIFIATIAIGGGAWLLVNRNYQAEQAESAEKQLSTKLKAKAHSDKTKEVETNNGKLVVVEPKFAGALVKYDAKVKEEAASVSADLPHRKEAVSYLTFAVEKGPNTLLNVKPTVKVYSRTKNQKLKLNKTVNLAEQTVNQDNGHALTLAELVPDFAARRALNYLLIKVQADDKNLANDALTSLLNKNFLADVNTTNFGYSDAGFTLAGAHVAASKIAALVAPAYSAKEQVVAPAAGKVIALTFDDGPNPNTTPTILHTLAENNIKATFFMVGKGAGAYPAIAKQVAAAGHEIGNHSFDHPQLSSLTPAQMTDQITRTSLNIYRATGKLPDFIRPPYGAVSQTVGATLNMPLIQWDIDTDDWATTNPAAIVSKVQANAHSGAIILMHDTHPQSVAALPGVISYLKQQGYQFKTVNELLGDRLLPGYQYFGQNDNRPV